MKTPEEWAKFEFENPLIKTGDFIAMIQKDAYNQAVDDSIESIQNYEMIWGNGARVQSNQFEREINKLKIK
jgi:hypothetical protein